jgi:hypothetical protein
MRLPPRHRLGDVIHMPPAAQRHARPAGCASAPPAFAPLPRRSFIAVGVTMSLASAKPPMSSAAWAARPSPNWSCSRCRCSTSAKVGKPRPRWRTCWPGIGDGEPTRGSPVRREPAARHDEVERGPPVFAAGAVKHHIEAAGRILDLLGPVRRGVVDQHVGAECADPFELLGTSGGCHDPRACRVRYLYQNRAQPAAGCGYQYAVARNDLDDIGQCQGGDAVVEDRRRVAQVNRVGHDDQAIGRYDGPFDVSTRRPAAGDHPAADPLRIDARAQDLEALAPGPHSGVNPPRPGGRNRPCDLR